MIQAVPKNGGGLLVVSRYPGEGIRIGSDVFVKITDIRGDRVQVGIAAERDVRIYREELLRTLTEVDQARDFRTHLERLARMAREVDHVLTPLRRPARAA